MATTYLPSTQEATIASLYEDVELLIIKQISDKLKAGVDAPDWQMRKALELELVKQKIQGQLNVTTTQAVKGVATMLKDNYTTGADDATKVFDAYLGAGSSVMPKGPLQPSKELYTLLKEQASGLAGVQHTILRSVDDVYRSVIAEVGAPGMLLGGQTRQQAVQSALNKFADKGVTGFVDKIGRQWEMSAYVSMATGTAAHRASTQGHLDQLAASGHDLVVVSDHKGECPQCRKWEGKVLSISGIMPKQTQDLNPAQKASVANYEAEKETLAKLMEYQASMQEEAYAHPGYKNKVLAGAGKIEAQREIVAYLKTLLPDATPAPSTDVAGTVAQARAEGLEHPGCRHRYSAWFEGISTAPEPQGKPADYDLRTQQRAMERQVRAWKRRAAAGDPKAPGKVKEWQAALKRHVDTNGLKRRSDREQLLTGKTGTFLEKKVVTTPPPAPPKVLSPEMKAVQAEIDKTQAKLNALSNPYSPWGKKYAKDLAELKNKLDNNIPLTPKVPPTPKVAAAAPKVPPTPKVAAAAPKKLLDAEAKKVLTPEELDLNHWETKEWLTKKVAEVKLHDSWGALAEWEERLARYDKAPGATISSKGTQFWVGKSAPVKPETMGLQPPTGPGAKVFDSWIEEAKARFKAFAAKTGNPKNDLVKSNNWTNFTNAMQGNTDSLKILLDGKYIDQKMYDDALELLKKATTPDPGDMLAYQQKMLLAKTSEQQYLLDLADWRVANNVPAPKVHGMDAAIRHTTDYQGTEWANANLQLARGEAHEALKKYTGGSYSAWNADLRANAGKPSGAWKGWSEKADKGFLPTPEAVIVNRGTGFNEFSVGGTRYGYDPLKLIGSVQRQDGYTSTSVGTTSAFSGDVNLRIMVPKGSKTAWVAPYSLHKSERELILPRGSNFLIHNVYKTPSGKWVVEAELLPEDYAGEAFGLQDLQPSISPFA